MNILLLLIQLSLSSFANLQDEMFPNKEIVQQEMQNIYVDMAKGHVPVLAESTEYYSGTCLTSYSAAKTPDTFSATVALKSVSNGIIEIDYTTGQGKYNKPNLESLPLLFTPKTKPYTVIASEHGGEYVQITIAEATAKFPAIYSALSQDKENPNKLYFIAILMGYYCRLEKI